MREFPQQAQQASELLLLPLLLLALLLLLFLLVQAHLMLVLMLVLLLLPLPQVLVLPEPLLLKGPPLNADGWTQRVQRWPWSPPLVL